MHQSYFVRTWPGLSIEAFVGISLALVLSMLPVQAEDPPPNFKIAFIGDQGLGPESEACLKLVKDEGAKVLVHLGDFDYANNPTAWEAQTNKVLGPEFLQVAVLGNHDGPNWTGATGYGALIKARFEKMGVPVVGEVGKKYSFKYKGIFFVFSTPGLEGGTTNESFIKAEMAKDTGAWRISNWHVLMHKMQAGTKGDESGWPVYEESRMAGAIIATAHEHSYFRSHLLSSMTNQTVVSKDTLLRLKSGVAAGQSFAFVSGLGGESRRAGAVTGDYIAKVYTTDENATEGAMFGVFNVDGNPRKANFYFKDVAGKIVDHFSVISEVNPGPVSILDSQKRLTVFSKRIGQGERKSIRFTDLIGRPLSITRDLEGNSTVEMGRRSGVFILRTKTGSKALGKIVVLP
jgi:hypothetical protein